MKPCLKSPLPRLCGESAEKHLKTVVFGEEIVEEVHIADVWDRTPTEPTKKLSYQWVSLPNFFSPWDDSLCHMPIAFALLG